MNNDYSKIIGPNSRNLQMLPYKGKGSLQMWSSQGSWHGEIILDYLPVF